MAAEEYFEQASEVQMHSDPRKNENLGENENMIQLDEQKKSV
jgi:hypothetical protein